MATIIVHRNTLDSPHGTVDRDRHGDWLHYRWDVHRNTLDSPHGTVDRDRHGDWLHHRWDVDGNTLDSPHGTVDRDRHGDWLHHRWDIHTAPLTCNVTNTRVHTQRHTRVHALAPNCGFQNGRLPGIHHQLQTEFLPCKSQ